MNFDNFDERIKQAAVQLNNSKKKSEEIIIEFEKLIPEFLNEWADSIVEGFITKFPGKVKALGSESITQLKKKISDFKKSLTSKTKIRLEKIKWIHLIDYSQKDLEHIFTFEFEKQINESLDSVLREIIGELGELFIKSGFSDSTPHSEWENRSGHIVYSYGIPDHYGNTKGEQFRRLKESYRKVIGEYLDAIKEFNKFTEDKKVAEAKNIWDRN